MPQNAHPISRILAYLIDYLLVYNTAFLVIHFLVGIDAWDALRLSQVVSVFYNIMFIIYLDGRTIGKKISKLQVVQEGGGKPGLLLIVIRETSKLLYIIPYFGIAVLIIDFSFLLMRRRLVHDLLSETRVIYNANTNNNI